METISQDIIRNVLFYFGDQRGWPAGSFVSHLLRAFQCADPENFFRLSRAFPDHAWAMRTVMNDEHGMETLAGMLTRE